MLRQHKFAWFGGGAQRAAGWLWWAVFAACGAQIVAVALMGGIEVVYACLGAPFLAAAFVLRRLRRADPVSTLASFTFLLMAAWMPAITPKWTYLGHPEVRELIMAGWLGLLTILFSTYPDGRFFPAWTRSFLLLVPVSVLLTFTLESPIKNLPTLLLAAMLIVAFASLAFRLRRLPEGQERQQLKWTAFGFVAGMPACVLGFGVALAGSNLPQPLKIPVVAAGLLLLALGFLMMPGGVIVSLLQYRLNDVDALMGRSSSFAAAAVLVACLSALGVAATETIVTYLFGAANPTWPKAVVALSAMAVFAPSQKRAMQWAETRFRPAFVRLQTLPARLAQWQHGEDPALVARGALMVIVDGIKAERGELLAVADGEARILARHAISGEGANETLPVLTETSAALVHDLRDDHGAVGTILLGPRSDGATYRRDEREAVTLIAAPLADALRATTDCERRNAALAAEIRQLTARIERLEAGPRGTEARRDSFPGHRAGRASMSDDKKKGDFRKGGKDDVGGDRD